MTLITEIPIKYLRFTQARISSDFDNDGLWRGYTIYTLAESARLKTVIISLNVFVKYPIMDTWPTTHYETSRGVRYTGSFITLDDFYTHSLNNRSLAAAILAGLEVVPVTYVDNMEVLDYSYEFDTMDKGRSVYVRGTGDIIRVPL